MYGPVLAVLVRELELAGAVGVVVDLEASDGGEAIFAFNVVSRPVCRVERAAGGAYVGERLRGLSGDFGQPRGNGSGAYAWKRDCGKEEGVDE